MSVPRKRLRGMLRFGFTTSAAVKVMLFHASDENRLPTMAVPMAATMAKPAKWVMVAPSLEVCTALQKLVVLIWMASALAAKNNPIIRKTTKARNLVKVKVFCTIFPAWIPRELSHVRKTMDAIAKSCTVLNCIKPRSSHTFFSENHGTNTPMNLAKAMPTAAMVPVCMTLNKDHP